MGFSIADAVTILGLTISSENGSVGKNILIIINKIKKQIANFSHFDLSLPGRISNANALSTYLTIN
jgi:hypothetical protein